LDDMDFEIEQGTGRLLALKGALPSYAHRLETNVSTPHIYVSPETEALEQLLWDN
jgi:hypothetical protein